MTKCATNKIGSHTGMLTEYFTRLKKELVLRVIRNRDIIVREEPFRHIVVDDFFEPAFYSYLCKAFQNRLDLGLSETPQRGRFARQPNSYDAYLWVPNPRSGFPLNFFYTAEWDELISGIFALRSSKDTILSFHHHRPNSKDGWIHSDFSLCSFVEDRLRNGINPWYHQCRYEDSTGDQQSGTFRRMRAVALIFYLLNDPQRQDGDGGETALYPVKDAKSPATVIAPRNNRLFAFEINPNSFHRFLSNRNYQRNTIIQWLHQEPEVARERYPDALPVHWRQ